MYYSFSFFFFVFWSRTILQASATSFPRFPASCYVTLQTSVSGILSCHSPSLNFRYPSLSRPKPCSGILPGNASRTSFRHVSLSFSKPQYPASFQVTLQAPVSGFVRWMPETEAWSAGPYYCNRVLISLSLSRSPPFFYFILYIPYVFSFSP